MKKTPAPSERKNFSDSRAIRYLESGLLLAGQAKIKSYLDLQVLPFRSEHWATSSVQPAQSLAVVLESNPHPSSSCLLSVCDILNVLAVESNWLVVPLYCHSFRLLATNIRSPTFLPNTFSHLL